MVVSTTVVGIHHGNQSSTPMMSLGVKEGSKESILCSASISEAEQQEDLCVIQLRTIVLHMIMVHTQRSF
jgi:hypothetical protein